MQRIKVDGNKLNELMKNNGYTQRKLAAAVGIDNTAISKYVCGKLDPSIRDVNAICFTLGCTLSDIKAEEKKAPETATEIVSAKETKDSINQLCNKLDSIQNDLAVLAKVVLQIQKSVEESKAQSSLNRDEITAVFNKVAECNGTLNKLYSKTKRY